MRKCVCQIIRKYINLFPFYIAVAVFHAPFTTSGVAANKRYSLLKDDQQLMNCFRLVIPHDLQISVLGSIVYRPTPKSLWNSLFLQFFRTGTQLEKVRSMPSRHGTFFGQASEVYKSTPQKICPYARLEISKTGDRIYMRFCAIA